MVIKYSVLAADTVTKWDGIMALHQLCNRRYSLKGWSHRCVNMQEIIWETWQMEAGCRSAAWGKYNIIYCRFLICISCIYKHIYWHCKSKEGLIFNVDLYVIEDWTVVAVVNPLQSTMGALIPMLKNNKIISSTMPQHYHPSQIALHLLWPLLNPLLTGENTMAPQWLFIFSVVHP